MQNEQSASQHDHLTVLTCRGRLILTKEIRLEEGVYSVVQQEKAPKTYYVRRLIVRDIRHLAASIEGSLMHDTKSCVIRGKPIIEIDKDAYYQRIKTKQKDGTPATFGGCARRWMMIDVDDFLIEIPAVQDIELAYRLVIEALPAEFSDVTCFVQLSATAGLPGRKGVKAHLWFWLSRPVSDAELKHWLADRLKRSDPSAPIDGAMFDPVQIHYTALPIYRPSTADPIAPEDRARLIEGASDVVEVPPIELPPPAPAPEPRAIVARPVRQKVEAQRIAATLGCRRHDKPTNGWFGVCPVCGSALFVAAGSGRIDCLGDDDVKPCTWEKLLPKLTMLGLSFGCDETIRAMHYARAVLARLESAVEGTRHNVMKEMTAQIFGFVEHRLIDAATVDRMLRDASARAGLPEEEARSIIEWGRQRASDDPRLPWGWK